MPRYHRKGVNNSSGMALKAAHEVLYVLQSARKTVGRAALAAVKRLRGRAAKSTSSTLDDHVYNDARVLSIATRMELRGWADGGTVKKIMKAVTKAKMYEALVGAHARRTANKKHKGRLLSLAAYAELAEKGFLKIDGKRKTLKEHLEATPEKDDERAAARARGKATENGAKPKTPQSAEYQDNKLKDGLQTKVNESQKKLQQAALKRRKEGKSFSCTRLKCYRKAVVKEVEQRKRVPGRTRYETIVWLRTKSGSLKKNKKGDLVTRRLKNEAPKTDANPDGGGETGYFPSAAAAYAAVKVHEDAEDADIAAHLAKKAAKK